MGAIVITFYSLFGQTRRVAEDLSLLTGGDLVPLVPVTEYQFGDPKASQEIRAQIDRGFCPVLTPGLPDYGEARWVFVGSPNWFHSLAPPVLTALRKARLQGRTLVPFCTHGGGGLGDIEAVVRRECPQSEVRAGKAFDRGVDLDTLRRWLDDLGLPHE